MVHGIRKRRGGNRWLAVYNTSPKNQREYAAQQESHVTLKVPSAIMSKSTLKEAYRAIQALKKIGRAVYLRGEPDIQFNRPLKECISWVGERQTGKTNGMLNFILMCPCPMEIWDTAGAIRHKLVRANITLPRHIKLIEPPWVLAKKAFPAYETRLSYFLPWCTKLWERQNVIGVVEEWHMYCKTKFAVPAEFGNLFNLGGNQEADSENGGIAMWGTSQSPQQVHNDILRACRHQFLYGLADPSDIRWMLQLFPPALQYLIEGDPKDPQALCVANLPDYEFLYYNRKTRQHSFYKPLKKY
jgi:hypothetical protein